MVGFFCGSFSARLDDKNRFVLPQPLRAGFIEGDILPPLTIGLGLGGCLAIYKRSEMDKIVAKFREKQHLAHFQQFFTLFFSMLHHIECDRLGRVSLSATLKRVAQLDKEIVLAGVLSRVEIWPKDSYESQLRSVLEGKGLSPTTSAQMEQAFSLLMDQDGKYANGDGKK